LSDILHTQDYGNLFYCTGKEITCAVCSWLQMIVTIDCFSKREDDSILPKQFET